MTIDYYEGYQGGEDIEPGFDDGGDYEKVGNEEYQDTSLHQADCICAICMGEDIDLTNNLVLCGNRTKPYLSTDFGTFVGKQ
jgi:hypothetical protein